MSHVVTFIIGAIVGLSLMAMIIGGNRDERD